MLLRQSLLVLALFLVLPAYADNAPSPLPPAPVVPPAINSDSSPASAPPANGVTSSAPNLLAAPPGPPDDNMHQLKTTDYILPTWPDMLHTMARFNAFDVEDNNLLDEYAAVTDCSIYGFYSRDDFKWNAIRKKLRESIAMNQLKYPAHYFFYTILQLEHYDFDNKLYRFNKSAKVSNVNIFTLFQSEAAACNNQKAVYIPKHFQALTDVPFTIYGLPLSQSDAQSLLRQMTADKNVDHYITAKFNLTINYIDRLRKLVDMQGKVSYAQAIDINPPPPGTARFYAHLDSVEFYEDPAMTKLVYLIKP